MLFKLPNWRALCWRESCGMVRSSNGTQLRQLTEPLLSSKEEPSPHEDAAPFSVATRSDILFSWVRPVLQRASRSRSQPCSAHSMSIDDLSSLPAGNGVHWADEQLQSRRRRYPTEPLARSMCGAFWRPMAHAGLLKLAADLLRYLPPLLLSILLRRLGSATPEPPGSVAVLVTYAIAFALPVVTLAQAVCVNQYFWQALHLGVLVRGAVAAAVCRRVLTLRLCEGGGGLADSGLLANLISSDCGRLMTVCGNINMLWSAPLQMGIAVTMLWLALGPCVCGGLAVMLLLIPLQVLYSPWLYSPWLYSPWLYSPWLCLLWLYLLWP